MHKIHLHLLIPIALAVMPASLSASQIFTFVYSLPAPSPDYDDISAHGTLTTDDPNPVLNAYLITGISGVRTVNGTDESITGLIAPGGFGGNSNLLYYPGPLFLDSNGLSFTIANSAGGDGSGRVNVFSYPDGAFTEITATAWYGTFDATMAAATGTETPEPTSAMLLALGGTAILLLKFRRPA